MALALKPALPQECGPRIWYLCPMDDHKSNKRKTPPPPKRVVLFVTCLVDQFSPNVGESVVDILEGLGIEVVFPDAQTCCGQPAFNSGYRDHARPVAARFLDIFAGEDIIVTPSGSCAAMVRNFYPELFHGDEEMLRRARATADRVWELTEFLVDVLGRTDLGGRHAGKVTYHKCCHLMRELRVDSQPVKLLEAVAGLGIKPLNRAEVCCGFGGAFSVKMSDISSAMLNEKLDNIVATGAGTVIAGDTGCIMHMQGGLRRRRSDVQVVHIAQFLAKSTERKGADN